MRGRREPLGSRVTPALAKSGTSDSVMAKQASRIDASTTWPAAPRASRAYRASRIPWKADQAASESPSEMPHRGGAWPGYPLMWRRPDIASPPEAKPGRSR